MSKQIIDLSGAAGAPFAKIEKIEDIPENPVDVNNSTEEVTTKQETVNTTSEENVTNNDTAETVQGSKENVTPEENSSNEKKESKPNVYRSLGNFLKKDGLFPEEIEIPEDADANFIKNNLKTTLESSLRDEVYTNVMQELSQQGINEHHLNMAMLLASGEDPNAISEVGRIQKYAELKLDDLAENEDYEDSLKTVIRSMYLDKGLNEKEAERMIKAAEIDDELEKVFEDEAVPYHKKRYEAIVQDTRRRQQEQIEFQKQQRKMAEDTVNNILTQKTVKGEKFDDETAKQLHSAIWVPNQVVEDQNGQRYQLTELQKFLHEFETDLELKIYMFKKWKFNESNKVDTKKIREDIEKEFEEGLTVTEAYRGDYDKQINEQRKNSNQFIIDL